MKKRWIVLGLVVLFFILASLGGEESENQQAAPTVTSASTATPTSTSMPTSQLSDSDREFINWVIQTDHRVMDALKFAVDAANSNNFSALELGGAMLRYEAEMALSEIDDFKISDELEDLRDEFKLALIDFKLAGINLEYGVRDNDAEKINRATEYINSASEHLTKSTELADKLLS
ncbi:hypothetical protein [Archaeoglobus sulfaticallidus]|nr:hypothetical protein [Archaeoglobus sulfaticallidus]